MAARAFSTVTTCAAKATTTRSAACRGVSGLGAGGAEEVVKLRLNAEEKRMLRVSEAAVRDVVQVLTLLLLVTRRPPRHRREGRSEAALTLCGA